tara:strand:- start:5972 stop:6655 length:684 start_codon:yes stop_codon:yes gene_type:complete
MISETACILEKWIDDYIEALQSNDSVIRRNVKSLIITNRVKPREAKQIANHFRGLLDEIDLVIDQLDDDLVEGWSYLNTTKLRRLRSYLESIVNEFSVKGTITRRKRKINPDKMIKSLKYLDNYDGIGESRDPRGIVGAKGVLLYNIKQKKISFYSSEIGLSIKGSTLKNFDGGVSKNCGRKDNGWIQLLIRVPTARMINEINTLRVKEQEATGRINKDTLILRIIR